MKKNPLQLLIKAQGTGCSLCCVSYSGYARTLYFAKEWLYEEGNGSQF